MTQSERIRKTAQDLVDLFAAFNYPSPTGAFSPAIERLRAALHHLAVGPGEDVEFLPIRLESQYEMEFMREPLVVMEIGLL